jgi:dipeptidyl aminopeptidase/acylaminoacyl peptidase
MKEPIPVTFESNGANIHAIFYQGSGLEPLPTAVLCHGFPGNKTDVLGLGERLMKEGLNALAFNYRGTWGSEGLLTIANSLDDVVSAIHFVKSSHAIRELNVDSSSISAIGYSFGGGMALLGSLKESTVKKVAYVAGGSLSEVARLMEKNDEYKRAVLKDLNSLPSLGLNSVSGEEMVAEVCADMDKYDLVKHAEAISSKDVLLIGGWRDQENTIERHMLPLVRALQKYKASQVKIEMFDADHSFANARTQLADKIVSWMKELRQ